MVSSRRFALADATAPRNVSRDKAHTFEGEVAEMVADRGALKRRASSPKERIALFKGMGAAPPMEMEKDPDSMM